MIRTIFLIMFLSIFMCSNAFALDPMRIRVRTELPAEIKTVGEAAQYYAIGAGYKLVVNYPAPEDSFSIAREEINPHNRIQAVLPIEEAILNLLAMNYYLVIDTEHKLFSFEKGE